MTTPEPSLVADLKAYDPKLRIRWAKSVEKFFIERKLDYRNPSLISEKPLEESASPLQRDLWDAWKEGYVHVLTVPVESAHWSLIAPYLAATDSWRQGGMEGVNRRLDAEAEAAEAAKDKHIDNTVEAMTDDAYEHMAWFAGRRVAVTTPEQPLVDTGLGFKMRDRRRGE